MSGQLDALRIRMDILVLGTQRAREEMKDNPVRHLAPCKCGRMDTRHDVCPLCAMDRLRKEML
jgi:ribosomal protein L32